MKDIKGFCKLFNLNIPNYTHLDYYLNQLSKVYKFRDIKEMINLYRISEDKVDDIFSYKIEKSKEIIDFLKKTECYKNLLNADINALPTNKSFKPDDSKKYISIDLKRANWQSLKKFDRKNELGNTYGEFLDKFEIEEVFKYSKSFRQFIFGNINPKKQIRVQRELIENLINLIGNNLKLECVRNDEVIYSYNISEDLDIIDSIDTNFYNFKIFSNKTIDNQLRIESILDRKGNIIYKNIVGCDKNIYYIVIKEQLTGEEIDIKDLYFKMDGKDAIWLHDKLKISL